MRVGFVGGEALDPILMGAEDAVRVHHLAPDARIVAVHMEALDHCSITRDDVRATAEMNGIAASVEVPEDGQALEV